MQLNHHPDFCRTISSRRKKQPIYPSQKLINANSKLIRAGKQLIRIFTHSFSYHVTKGWRVVARDWKGER